MNLFFPYLVVLLVGGLASVVLPAWLLRRPGARERLARLKARWLWAYAAAAVVLGLAAVAWLLRPFLAPGGAAVPGLVAFGVVVMVLAVPLSIPAVVFAWKEARTREATRAARRASTKDDRRAFAEDLLRQIEDASPEPRTLKVGVAGDGGSILRFSGDLTAKEGERLTRALREDLRDMGFKRVEGDRGAKGWWSRV